MFSTLISNGVVRSLLGTGIKAVSPASKPVNGHQVKKVEELTSEEEDQSESEPDENNKEVLEHEGIGKITKLDPEYPVGIVDSTYHFHTSKFHKDFNVYDIVEFKARKEPYKLEYWIYDMKLHKTREEKEIDEALKFKTYHLKVVSASDYQITVKQLELPDNSTTVQIIPIKPSNRPDFHVIPGDWIEVKCQETVKGLGNSCSGEILSIKPSSLVVEHGTITKLLKESPDDEAKFGILNDFCLIEKTRASSSIDNYFNVGRPIKAIVIKSDQFVHKVEFSYRAITHIPDIQAEISRTRNKFDDMYLDKKGIVIKPQELIRFKNIRIGHKSEEVFHISNLSKTCFTLKNIVCQSDQTVAKFTINVYREDTEFVTVLEPDASYEVKLSCEGVRAGKTEEILIFDFISFQIHRKLLVSILPLQQETIKALSVSQVNPTYHLRLREEERREIKRKLEGFNNREKVYASSALIRPAFFKPKALGEGKFIRSYPIPQYVKDAAEKCGSNEGRDIIFDNCKTLRMSLEEYQECFNNRVIQVKSESYVEMFHLALWFEEYYHLQRRQRYSLESVNLIPSGDCYYFEFPALQDVYPPFLIGEPIGLCNTQNPTGKEYMVSILRLGPAQIFLSLDPNIEIDKNVPYAVKFLLGRSSYKRSHAAIDEIYKEYGEEWLFPTQFLPHPPKLTFIEEGNEEGNEGEFSNGEIVDSSLVLLRTGSKGKKKRKNRGGGVLGGGTGLGRRSNFHSDTIKEIEIEEEEEGKEPKVLKWANKSLNKEQKKAVRMILRGQSRPLPYIIFGPPGTGKSVTVAEAVIQINKLDKKSRVVVSGPSNAAADQLCLYLIQKGKYKPGEFVRLIGYNRGEETLSDVLKEYCFDGNCLESIINCRIIVTTCNTASQLLDLHAPPNYFSHVFIDEAGYCYEPDSAIPSLLIAKNPDAQLILAGDPNQLGPVVFSDIAAFYGLKISFLERLMRRCPLYEINESGEYDPLLITKLVKNYRAHPALLYLPSKLFYNSELVAARPLTDFTKSDNLSFLKKKGIPFIFNAVRGDQARDRDSPSWYNLHEVFTVLDYVRLLLENDYTADDIGIITPYRKQVEKIRESIKRELKCRMPRVGSVEEFQGGEKKIIIVSLVRSMNIDEETESIQRLSFVFEPKRFNVCVTRAKNLLIIIGNPHVFLFERVWMELMKYSILKGVCEGSDLPQVLQDYKNNLKVEKREVEIQEEISNEKKIVENEETKIVKEKKIEKKIKVVEEFVEKDVSDREDEGDEDVSDAYESESD